MQSVTASHVGSVIHREVFVTDVRTILVAVAVEAANDVLATLSGVCDSNKMVKVVKVVKMV